ncbi:glycoside hydrolase family 28 protein [Pradoshia sp. D12]|uniref:glycoside hydrolase family 28 protein n=1 Tax=Bacillaceae TaxID=186817 RepID=UPI00080AF79C|nr:MULTISPECIES: glycoside hydrolase family 28 protein [Bacillaceae]OCA89411.1 endopolygalacturonase [Bacillus sp. FJAT-27986]QFK71207.1 glycoside hydrolase family 28 protein [Pradoshia sp. D12]TPF73000.1 glycoside hydrolase family 28 protein [Bacillus sp. D12]
MTISVPSCVYDIQNFGAVNDGETINTVAITQAIETCSEAGGGTVYIPAGECLTGAVILKSNVHLYIEAGAILKFTTDINAYPIVNSRWEGTEQEVYASCIYAENVENVSITGHGTIDGNGAFWWEVFRRKENQYPRPKLVSFDSCKRVIISGLKMINSPSWTVNPICCEDVTVNLVTIVNPPDSPNTDGINPESCRNVRISDCHIDVGDDCIAIKAGTEATDKRIPCENITITNCTMIHGHGGIVLGSEMSGDIRNVTVSNCVFEGTDRGIRLKSRRGRGGVIEDIRINNIVMNRVICPFIANLYYYCGPRGKDQFVSDKKPYPITEETPVFRRIHFSNITAREVSAAAGFFFGLAEKYVEDVTFNQVSVAMANDAEPGLPAMMEGLEPMKQVGFYCSNVKDMIFNQVIVSNHKGPAFCIENAIGIEIKDCSSRTEEPNLYVMKNVK